MKRRIELFSVDGYSIEYTILGTGEPVLVMHGGHSNCYEEFRYQALLDNGYMIITPSREIGESLSIACKYYIELLTHLNIEKVHVLAISAGGPSGIYLASQYPERVHTLTLQSAVTKEWLTLKDMQYKVAKILFRPKFEKCTWKLISLLNNIFPQFLFKQMSPSFSTLAYRQLKEHMIIEDVEAIRKMNNRQRSGYGFLLDLEQTSEIHLEDLKTLTCTTFIMHSKYDGLVPIEHAYYANEHISSSKLYLSESWGHLIWLGKSAIETDEMFLTFLQTYKMC